MTVHGTDVATARTAALAAGLAVRETFDRVGVVVAAGLPAQIDAVRRQPGVTYVEGNEPITIHLATSNTATRGEQARRTLTGANGLALDGSGVSVAVIDSGVDPNHPFFAEPDGSSAVVRNLKMACDPLEITPCVPVDAGMVDTDTLAAGGHGTHVAGIVAGRDVTLSDGTAMHGAAPGAKLVSLGTGAVLFIIGADSALNWVLKNHRAPCGTGVPASTCPPIKVTSNSYGPSGGGDFDPDSATAKLQRELVKDGVVTVWPTATTAATGRRTSPTRPARTPPRASSRSPPPSTSTPARATAASPTTPRAVARAASRPTPTSPRPASPSPRRAGSTADLLDGSRAAARGW